MTKSVAHEVKFIDFCSVLDDIYTCGTHPLKCEKLQQYFKRYRDMGLQLKQGDPSADTSFFQMLRLLLPQLERERPPYGLSILSLRKILSKILGFTRDSAVFRKLGSAQHDFAQVAYGLLKKQFVNSKNLSLSEINDYLDSMARYAGESGNAGKLLQPLDL